MKAHLRIVVFIQRRGGCGAKHSRELHIQQLVNAPGVPLLSKQQRLEAENEVTGNIGPGDSLMRLLILYATRFRD